MLYEHTFLLFIYNDTKEYDYYDYANKNNYKYHFFLISSPSVLIGPIKFLRPDINQNTRENIKIAPIISDALIINKNT